ncbi:O-antigen ligase family protein [Acetobacteraceae bacterium]|nr:O-antigen ligase family protein [Acetobacteraceae bacterium]
MRPPFLAAGARTVTHGTGIWWLSFLSLTGFVLGTRYGMPAMAICLGAWGLYVAAWPGRCVTWMTEYRLPWLLPVWATMSTLWSIEPNISIKLGIEFLVFTALAIVAARAQTLRSLISSFMCALLVGVVLSAITRTTAAVGTTGEVALIGVFGSKNNLASFVCLSMMTSLSVLVSGKQPRHLRALALLGLAIDPILLLKAHSLGALLAGGGAMVAALGIVFLSSLSQKMRGLVLPLLVVTAAGVGLVVLLAFQQGFDLSSLLAAAGKDASLTGRTFLWSRARDYIDLKPMLGVGYQAFWVQGHVEAEGLWRFAQIASRSGFHFHNLYYETAVELGEIGAAFLAVSLVFAAIVTARRGLRYPDAEAAFLCALVVFYAIRVSVELDFLDPFSPGSFLLPVLWVYSVRYRGENYPRSAPWMLPQ